MIDLKVAFNNPDQEVELTLGPVGSSASGIDRLSQKIVLSLLTDTGTKTGLPNFGGSIKKITMTKNLTGNDDTRAQIHTRIMEVERSLKEEQSVEDLPDDETLVSLVATKVSYNKELAKWEIELLIVTLSGDVNPIVIG